VIQRVIDAVRGDHAVRVIVIGGEAAVNNVVEEELGQENPVPAWNADFPRTYIGTKGGYIEVKDGKFYVCSAGSEVSGAENIARWWFQESNNDLNIIPERYHRLFDTCDLTGLQGYDITKLDQPAHMFLVFQVYIERFGDGRRQGAIGTINVDDFFVFSNIDG
jgi:hypothetical protein